MSPEPQYLQLWAGINECPLVTTPFGAVPKGSILSYQLTRPSICTSSASVIQLLDVPDPPEFTFTPQTNHHHSMSGECASIFGGLHVSDMQSHEYEIETRSQSENDKWHSLRTDRLTASKCKRVCSRKGDFHTLCAQFTSDRVVQTKQMKYVLDHEPEAAENYAITFCRNVYAVGFVINPTACHLGCSPDRRVYDPDADEPYGLLEIKCPSVESVVDCKYIKRTTDLSFKLNKNHAYYYQIMGQLGITGQMWCDFYVQAHSDFHCERITFDQIFYDEIKAKLDTFYFTYFLPFLANRTSEA